MQESEYESTEVIYTPTEKYKYIVITESDTYYRNITYQRIQKYNLKRDIHNQKLRGAHEQQEESREPFRRRARRKEQR